MIEKNKKDEIDEKDQINKNAVLIGRISAQAEMK